MGMFGAITGILASRGPQDQQYFTSALYPLFYEENLALSSTPISGNNWEYAEESLALSAMPISGTLIDTIVYVSYNNAVPEKLALSATPISGTLDVVIAYQTYDNAVVENLALTVTPISGTLT